MTEHHYIEVKNLIKNYSTGNITVNAVDHVSFYVDKGDFIGIMGASGSGKTTILNILSTIDTMSDGHVFYDNIDISKMNEAELSDFRQKNLGFVFQEYNLLDTLSIEENIMLPMALGGEKKEETENRIRHISETLHIDDILSKFPYEVSGGQKQRAACARALVNKPKLILADEPTGALDSKSSTMVLHTLQVMNRELGATIIMVTHDALSASYAKRVIFLKDGKIYIELQKGEKERRHFFTEILDVVALLGGERKHVS